MNLQTLSIILIVIIVPITLVLSTYTKIQIDTITEQTMLRTKLKDATYDAIVAFQLNTVNNSYSTVSDSMRRDVSAAVQTFISNLATNMGVSGTDEVNIKPYIPAIVFTLYDGYYIYSPAISHKTTIDSIDNQSEFSAYEHVLKPYIYYTIRYVNDNVDVVVNYTLDNYIVVSGLVDGKQKYVTNAGYLVNRDSGSYANQTYLNETLERRLPVTTITFVDNENKSFVKDVNTYSTDMADMIVTDSGMLEDRLTNGRLLDDEYGTLFKDSKQLSVNRDELTKDRPEMSKLSITRELIMAEFEKADSSDDTIKLTAKGNVLKKWFKLFYDSLNPQPREYSLGFYVNPSTDQYYIQPNSAQEYYDKAIEFSEWVDKYLGDIKSSDAVKSDGTHYSEFTSDKKIFKINSNNDPDDEGSIFNDHRRTVLKLSIQDNLSQAIASYNQNSENLGTLANFQMPVLSEIEWNQVLNNVCLITFMQGKPVGTKLFNDYCIVTSTKNKEYVSPESIYYINTTNPDGYYHKIDCPHLTNNTTDKIVGYRNSDFDRRYYEVENIVSDVRPRKENRTQDSDITIDYSNIDKQYYYYMHPELACYYCIVNQSSENRVTNWKKTNNNRSHAYYTAMAREKYNFYKTNSYFTVGN